MATPPSPGKEEVVELSVSSKKEKKVIDFTYLDEKYGEEDVVEIEEREPREGDKDPADLPALAVHKDGEVMQLVVMDYIRKLLKSPPSTRPLKDCSVEAIRSRTGITDEEDLQTMARSGRALRRLRDIHNDIIRQYLDKGYAYIALPDDAPNYPLPTDRDQLPPLP